MPGSDVHLCNTRLFKHAVPSYVVRGTGPLSLRLSNKKNDNLSHLVAIWCECPISNHKYVGHMADASYWLRHYV